MKHGSIAQNCFWTVAEQPPVTEAVKANAMKFVPMYTFHLLVCNDEKERSIVRISVIVCATYNA